MTIYAPDDTVGWWLECCEGARIMHGCNTGCNAGCTIAWVSVCAQSTPCLDTTEQTYMTE